MSDIVVKSSENECGDTGRKRKYQWRIEDGKEVWYKPCPQCGGEQVYTTLRAISWATTHRKVCYSCKNSGKNNPFSGKTHSESHRAELSKRQKECSYRYKQLGHNPPKLQKTCQWCKSPYEVIASRSASKYCCYECAWRDNYGFNWNRKSTPEKRVEEILQSLGIRYQYGFPLGGKVYDFFIEYKNLLLEVDGIYWHAKGLTWGEMTPGQRKARKNDEQKNKIARENGFQLIRVWEDEVEIVPEYIR